MSLHKFGYSSEPLKLKEYQELKDMIKSQKKLAQITHSKTKEDFENDIENQEELKEEKILNPQEIQNVFLNPKLINYIYSQFSDLSKTINKLEQNMKRIFRRTKNCFSR